VLSTTDDIRNNLSAEDGAFQHQITSHYNTINKMKTVAQEMEMLPLYTIIYKA